MTKTIEVTLNYVVYATSIILVSVSVISELTRIANYSPLVEFDGYTIFIIGSAYTGIFVRSANYNAAMALLASPVFFTALSHGVMIESGELGRQLKGWTWLVGVFALGGWVCNSVYITSRLLDFVLDRLEYLLPERIRQRKRNRNHMLW